MEAIKKRQVLAQNIRRIMVDKDITQAHIRHLLNISQPHLSNKLSGKTDFGLEEIIKLADYLQVSEEELWKDSLLDLNFEPLNGKDKNHIPVKQIDNDMEKMKPHSINTLISETVELSELLSKIFKAKLIGKIEDLTFPLRNNLLARASQLFGGEVDKDQFVEHYLKEYEKWKKVFMEDLEDALQVSLVTNEQEVVIGALLPSTKNRLSQFLNNMIKDETDDDKLVNIEELYEDIDRAIIHLERTKVLLDNYLNNKRK